MRQGDSRRLSQWSLVRGEQFSDANSFQAAPQRGKEKEHSVGMRWGAPSAQIGVEMPAGYRPKVQAAKKEDAFVSGANGVAGGTSAKIVFQRGKNQN